jgi:hypothetical protein
MTMSNMGFLLGQRYKHAVALLVGTIGYSETYFLLEGEPTSTERLMCLAWVNGDHFMAIRLKSGSPYLRLSRCGMVTVPKMRQNGHTDTFLGCRSTATSSVFMENI